MCLTWEDLAKMNYFYDALGFVRGRQQSPPQLPTAQEIQIPQFVKDNAYLTASAGLAVLKGPKTLAFGGASALFCRLVSSETIPSRHKPLVDRFLTIIQPVLDQPLSVADTVAFCALMMFDDFAPITTWWIGLNVALLLLPKPRQE
ncbi:MAG: hypothetical protein ACE5GN_00630 [Waddliaceae bacterium]